MVFLSTVTCREKNGAEKRAGLKARPYDTNEKIRECYLRQSEQTPPISVRLTVISMPVSLAI